jgi:hypothetical protein
MWQKVKMWYQRRKWRKEGLCEKCGGVLRFQEATLTEYVCDDVVIWRVCTYCHHKTVYRWSQDSPNFTDDREGGYRGGGDWL